MAGWQKMSTRASKDGDEISFAKWAFFDGLMHGALVTSHHRESQSSKDRSASRPSGRRQGFKKRPRKGNK